MRWFAVPLLGHFAESRSPVFLHLATPSRSDVTLQPPR
jgi:hypothetical protein